jgi:hypothetical protein
LDRSVHLSRALDSIVTISLFTFFFTVFASAAYAQTEAKSGAKPAAESPKPSAPGQQLSDNAQGSLYFIEPIELVPGAKKSSQCQLLPDGDNRALSAFDIVQLIGTVAPFSMTPRGNRVLLVYATRPPQDPQNATDSYNALLT